MADLTLRSTPDSTPDWEWSSINLSIHPTIKNVRTTVATLNRVAIAKPGTKKNARSATIRRKNGVPVMPPRAERQQHLVRGWKRTRRKSQAT